MTLVYILKSCTNLPYTDQGTPAAICARVSAASSNPKVLSLPQKDLQELQLCFSTPQQQRHQGRETEP